MSKILYALIVLVGLLIVSAWTPWATLTALAFVFGGIMLVWGIAQKRLVASIIGVVLTVLSLCGIFTYMPVGLYNIVNLPGRIVAMVQPAPAVQAPVQQPVVPPVVDAPPVVAPPAADPEDTDQKDCKISWGAAGEAPQTREEAAKVLGVAVDALTEIKQCAGQATNIGWVVGDPPYDDKSFTANLPKGSCVDYIRSSGKLTGSTVWKVEYNPDWNRALMSENGTHAGVKATIYWSTCKQFTQLEP